LLIENDILFARSGATAGKCFIYKKEYGKAIYAGYLIRFKFDEAKVNPLYVFFYTQSQRYTLWVKSIQRPAGQPNINSQEFKAFTIPLPPLSIQNQIVEIMQSAYAQKKQKEQEAEKLLASIDDYVLEELGIKLPELKDEQCYVVDSKEIDRRVDPYYYQPKFSQAEEVLRKGKYNLVSLKDVFGNGLIKGILPAQEEKTGDVKVLQIRNIGIDGTIDISEYVTAKNIFSKDYLLCKGDVIIVITGATIGKVGLWLFEKDNFYLGGDMVKFQPVQEYNSYYIQAFLLTEYGQLQIKRYTTGATNKHLSPDDVKQLKIPSPPLPIQSKIADEVKRRMSEAQDLRAKSNELVEQAKRKVEDLILNKAK